MERIPIGSGDGGTQDSPLSAYCCVPVEPKALVASKTYHVVITTNFCVNRIGTRQEGNILNGINIKSQSDVVYVESCYFFPQPEYSYVCVFRVFHIIAGM
jgi:hypothetical protein